MWLKYQQAHAKMASFDPRELVRNKDGDTNIKYPLQRFEPTLRSSLKVAVPINIDRLKKHKRNIEKYAHKKQWKELNEEQINASRTVQQLKATIRDLEKTKYQIKQEDLEKFIQLIDPIKEQSLNAIQEFALVQDVISKHMQASLKGSQNGSDNEKVSGPSLWQQESGLSSGSHNDSSESLPNQSITKQIQVDDALLSDNSGEIVACQSWDQLREGLVELNGIVTDFAKLVNEQQENVDHIEENIESAQQNVHAGAKLLGQASKYKAALIPVAGAVVGGLVGGPIGLLAGFKIAGVAAAVGGGVVGYQGGKYMKRKHDERVEVELDNLSKND